jgi:uncharacterized protein DUF1059
VALITGGRRRAACHRIQRPLASRRERPNLHPMATEARSASPLDGPREVDMKTLHCGDLMQRCDFVATGATEDEVITA